MPPFAAVIVVLSLVVLLAAAWLFQVAWQRQRIRARLLADDVADPFQTPADESRGWLARWLYLAGFRSPWASVQYLASTALLAGVGLAFALLIVALGVVDLFVQLLLLIPGNVGEVFLPVAYGSPWTSALLLAAIPTLVVRAARQRRVSQVEQDLPLSLDLLATLAQAGIGYDAAVDQLLDTLPPTRALSQELRAYQLDMFAGRGRVAALRRLSRRVEVAWFSIFISAVVQAEQMGSGLSEVLQTQAEDLRQRRRERAMAFAMTIPIKLLFPLVACFLPGIFVFAVGPAFFQIAQTIDNLLAPYVR
ncbi:MAG: type II secretion system F family protein [Pirellulales bacterium]